MNYGPLPITLISSSFLSLKDCPFTNLKQENVVYLNIVKKDQTRPNHCAEGDPFHNLGGGGGVRWWPFVGRGARDPERLHMYCLYCTFSFSDSQP